MKSNSGQTRHFKNDKEKRLPRVFTIRLIRGQPKLTTKTEFARFTCHKKPLYKNNFSDPQWRSSSHCFTQVRLAR